MRLMITDSGLGGLSVCAGLEKKLRNSQKNIELLFVNANPFAEGGYNTLKSQVERTKMFDQFLQNAVLLYKPDSIAIACNTLSVIYDDTVFSSQNAIPVIGIADAAIHISKDYLEQHPDHGLIIFATETTIESGLYENSLPTNKADIVPQVCPNLASAISRDASGSEARGLLDGYVANALSQLKDKHSHVAALLACTHYTYQSATFERVLLDEGIMPCLLDPNTIMVEQLLNLIPQVENDRLGLSVRFITHHPIPKNEMNAMAIYLKGEAPLTYKALLHHECESSLFMPSARQ